MHDDAYRYFQVASIYLLSKLYNKATYCDEKEPLILKYCDFKSAFDSLINADNTPKYDNNEYEEFVDIKNPGNGLQGVINNYCRVHWYKDADAVFGDWSLALYIDKNETMDTISNIRAINEYLDNNKELCETFDKACETHLDICGYLGVGKQDSICNSVFKTSESNYLLGNSDPCQ